jgi:hypothetical protein
MFIWVNNPCFCEIVANSEKLQVLCWKDLSPVEHEIVQDLYISATQRVFHAVFSEASLEGNGGIDRQPLPICANFRAKHACESLESQVLADGQSSFL